MNTVNERIEYLIAELKRRRVLCLEMLKHAPEGSLSVYKKNNHVYYNTHLHGRTRHLSKGDPLIEQLQDAYLVRQTLSAIEKQLALLEAGSRERIVFDPNELRLKFPPAYQNPGSDVFKVIGFEDARVWAEEPYIRNKKYPEHLIVTAWNGTKVRSRIESSILDIYRDMGIPVRYDEIFLLPGGRQIYPDFHPLVPGVLRDMRHEHFGMLSDPDYLKRDFLWKHEQFTRLGLVPQQDILYTFDGPNGEIDLPLIRYQISRWIDRVRSE